MKILFTHIITAIITDGGDMTSDGFMEAAQNWFNEEDIVAGNVNAKEGNVRVVFTEPGEPTVSLARFFQIGNKWQVSIDQQAITTEQMMQVLMNPGKHFKF